MNDWRCAPRSMVLLASALWLGCSVVSCVPGSNAIRVGVKGFAEQEVLGEVLVRLVRANASLPARVVRCGDTYGCQRAMQRGQIDLMVEYSGTLASFLGLNGNGATHDRAHARQATQQALAALGLRWLEPIGFDNGFRLLMRADRAALLGVRAIADLEGVEQGVRIACPLEYLRRPRDGLASLTRRHGIRQLGAPVVIDDVSERYRALADGQVDVVVGYGTDASIMDLGLAVLDDSLGFFSAYEAAVLAGSHLFSTHPALEAVLQTLSGRISTDEMRRLNHAVQIEGRAPAGIAAKLLASKGLVKRAGRVSSWAPSIVVAVHELDPLPGFSALAARATRAAFPDRSVAMRPSADPVADVASGRARLAMLSAERFFQHDQANGLVGRENRVEALAVVGVRVVHAIRREDAPPGTLLRRVGLPPKGTSGEVVGRALVRSVGVSPTAHDSTATLLRELRTGALDTALVAAPVGDPLLAQTLSAGGLRLASLTSAVRADVAALSAPYLHPVRLPAGTYVSQGAAVETYGLQVVLAGFAPTTTPASGIGGGHVAALRERGQPLSETEVRRLADATQVTEPPDPALPSAWAFRPADQPRTGGNLEWLDTVLNMLVFAFLLWLARLVLDPIRPVPRALESLESER